MPGFKLTFLAALLLAVPGLPSRCQEGQNKKAVSEIDRLLAQRRRMEAALEKRLGLAKMKSAFYELCSAEDRAGIGAKHAVPYPDLSKGRVSDAEVMGRIDKREAVKKRLTAKYKSPIYRKHRITEAEARVIVAHGAVKNWPTPALRESY